MQYNFEQIESRWRSFWQDKKTFKVSEQSDKPKYYVLDMFPYPSGAGLHVGHPLGYIASDIFAKYKILEGFNVLHPMGFDAFGLPAEQYAIQTGQHPATTTEKNITTFKSQFDLLGLGFDPDREFQTCSPDYYKWTQWSVIQFFEHWYDNNASRARVIDDLIQEFEKNGNRKVNAVHNCDISFSANDWRVMSDTEKQKILLQYRLAYLAETHVNWCPALGTVLANDEIKDGLSERGGHPVEQKMMRQWSLRVSAYASRLLDGLSGLDWSESVKEVQRNWIGKSEGAQVEFEVCSLDFSIKIYTTRPDTIFGTSFMVLAPESKYVQMLTTDSQKDAVEKYVEKSKNRTERDRQVDVKNVTGVFSGSYCINPFTDEKIPVWIADYVLGGYGTGAIMAVPAHDERDNRFAKTFNLTITYVYEGAVDGGDFYDVPKDSSQKCLTGPLEGLTPRDAISKSIELITEKGLGSSQTNYRLRDATFSRQRYWGEPFPFYFKDDLPYPVDESELPIVLPEVDKYLPTEDGQPPLGRAKNWQSREGYPLELSTMPGFAGSSAYFLRFMDPGNPKELVSNDAVSYWENVDLYMGGSEHATGHLIYARFWNMFLYDIGLAQKEEPFKRMINQGMIQGVSSFVYRIKGTNKFVSRGLKDSYDTQKLHVYVGLVKDDELDIEGFKNWRPDYKDAEFELEDGVYLCDSATEKMSKSMFNVVNPNDIVRDYGSDTLRLHEMFLGPLEQSKPWSTGSIEGVHKFLGRFWRLFFEKNSFLVSDEKPSKEELKILHTCIKKVRTDTETFNFNTAISAMMICVNELTKLGCRKKEILTPLVTIIAPYCPHLAEELHHKLGAEKSIFKSATLPSWDESLLVENTFNYPVSVNGKMKFLLELPKDYSKDQVERAVLQDERTSKFLGGKKLVKLIVVPGRIVNLVVK